MNDGASAAAAPPVPPALPALPAPPVSLGGAGAASKFELGTGSLPKAGGAVVPSNPDEPPASEPLPKLGAPRLEGEPKEELAPESPPVSCAPISPARIIPKNRRASHGRWGKIIARIINREEKAGFPGKEHGITRCFGVRQLVIATQARTQNRALQTRRRGERVAGIEPA